MAAVVALVSIGQGAKAQISGQIEGIGANLIAVIPGRVEDHGAMGSGGTPQTLTLSDAQAVGGVVGVAAVGLIYQASGQFVASGRRVNAPIHAATPRVS